MVYKSHPGRVYKLGSLYSKWKGLLCGNPTERAESLILNFWPPGSLQVQPRHRDCLPQARGFRTGKNTIHQIFILSNFKSWSMSVGCCSWISSQPFAEGSPKPFPVPIRSRISEGAIWLPIVSLSVLVAMVEVVGGGEGKVAVVSRRCCCYICYLWYLLSGTRVLMRAVLPARPKCSHWCISLEKSSLNAVRILKHATERLSDANLCEQKVFTGGGEVGA